MNYAYNLIDDGGVNTVWDIPFKMAIGSTFEHEFGTYKVTEHKEQNGINWVDCERIAKP
jgi:hypothetical protein